MIQRPVSIRVPYLENTCHSNQMADLDAELLALAGGDESSGEESSSPPRRKSPSPQRPVKQSRASPAADMGRKGTAKVVRKVKRRKDDSEDDQV